MSPIGDLIPGVDIQAANHGNNQSPGFRLTWISCWLALRGLYWGDIAVLLELHRGYVGVVCLPSHLPQEPSSKRIETRIATSNAESCNTVRDQKPSLSWLAILFAWSHMATPLKGDPYALNSQCCLPSGFEELYRLLMPTTSWCDVTVLGPIEKVCCEVPAQFSADYFGTSTRTPEQTGLLFRFCFMHRAKLRVGASLHP